MASPNTKTKKNYNKSVFMIKTVRVLAVFFISIFFVFLYRIKVSPGDKVPIVFVVSFVVSVVFGLAWLLMVCPRCDKLFFQKQKNSFLIGNTFLNPFSNKCLNCGLSLKYEKQPIKGKNKDVEVE